MTQDNEEALEQEYNRILGESEETIKNEDKIAEKTIESSEEKNESDIKEGEKIPSEIEEELKNIDPELREILLKADSETRKAQVNAFNKMRSTIDKKHTEFGHQKKIAEAAQSLFDKYGIDPNSGFSQIEKLIEFEKAYEENPEKIVSLLQAKINKTRNETGSEIDEEQFTEQEKYLYKKIKSIDESNQKLIRENEELKGLREKKEIEQAREEIIKFANAKNEDGNLSHPYFYEVAEDIQKLLVLYPNDTLDQLYSRATRLNDEIYNKSLASLKEKEQKKAVFEKEQNLKKAKSLNSQSLKASSKISDDRNLDDILSDIYDNAQG